MAGLGAGAGVPAAGGGAAVAGGAGGVLQEECVALPGGAAAGAPAQPGGGTSADIIGWMLGVGNNRPRARCSGWGMKYKPSATKEISSCKRTQLRWTAVMVAAATTVYYYAPSVVEYALQDTQCYVDWREDYRAMLRLNRPEAPLGQLDKWFGVLMGIDTLPNGSPSYSKGG